MIKIKNFKITNKLILLTSIFIVAVFTRFYNIQKVPTFIHQDEMGYLISAISMNLSGSDIVGTWDPLSFSPVSPLITALDEVTTQFIYPFYKLPLNNVLAGKLPFIIISLLVPFFIAGIAYEFTKSKSVQMWAWIISLFNPWIWQGGRMSIDASVSFIFYILGGYLILKLKNWQKLWSVPVLFFGFYNYQGHKLVFIFWVFIFCLYSVAPYLSFSKNIKNLVKKSQFFKILPSLIVFIFSITLFLIYTLLQLPNHESKNRLKTFYTPDSPGIASIVNTNRRLSLDSPLNSILINKYSVWTGKIFEKFIETYGFQYLFLSGQEDHAPFTVWNHGIFYVIDSILILFGFAYLLDKKRYGLMITLLFGLASAVIPSLISAEKAYFYRSSLNIPLLIILAAMGISYINSFVPKYGRYFLYFIYLLSILYFSYLYFIRYPLFSSKRQYFSDRVLTEYLRRLPPNQEVTILTLEPEFSVTSYLFYTDYLNKNNIHDVQNMFQTKNYKINNVKFLHTCVPKNINEASGTVLIRWDTDECVEGEKSNLAFDPINSDLDNRNNLQIKDIDDAGTVFNIYNDTLCLNQELNPYLRIHQSNQFDFNNQSDKEFCSTWISKFVEPN